MLIDATYYYFAACWSTWRPVSRHPSWCFICTVKAGSQYDAGSSVASWALGWRWNRLDFYSSIVLLVLVSIQPIRLLKKYDTRNRIWLVKRYFSRNAYDTRDAHGPSVILLTRLKWEHYWVTAFSTKHSIPYNNTCTILTYCWFIHNLRHQHHILLIVVLWLLYTAISMFPQNIEIAVNLQHPKTAPRENLLSSQMQYLRECFDRYMQQKTVSSAEKASNPRLQTRCV